jgi:hypothetical protein
MAARGPVTELPWLLARRDRDARASDFGELTETVAILMLAANPSPATKLTPS